VKIFDGVFGKVLRKQWPPEKVELYVGKYRQSYQTYAADESIRSNAASGGSVTALLAFLLQNGQIDGALVCRTRVEENKVRAEFFIAKTVEELKSAQASKYISVYFASQATPLIRKFDGRLAVVGLPCDIEILTRSFKDNSELRMKVIVTITLFCGHNSEPILTDRIVRRLNLDNQNLIDYRFREGHWRGSLRATFENGSVITKPFSYFSDYQNLYFFCQRKCHYCHDHTGYFSDISAGDTWSLRMKQNPIKHTALITRSEIGEKIVQDALSAGALIGQVEPIDEICEGQARTLPFHYNVSARSRLGWIAGEKIKDSVHARVPWNEYIVAALVLFNERISRSKIGQKIIFKMPRQILKLYLYFFKMLESF
jgi:coenzyme F420 hydrogenase subunit beta